MLKDTDLIHKYTWRERSDDEKDFYQSREYRELREDVRFRDDYLCQWCLAQDIIVGGTVCHHKIEVGDGELGWSLRLDPDNCVLICFACHAKAHNRHGGESVIQKEQLRDTKITSSGTATMSDLWGVLLNDE